MKPSPRNEYLFPQINEALYRLIQAGIDQYKSNNVKTAPATVLHSCINQRELDFHLDMYSKRYHLDFKGQVEQI
jgi:hypothetical protein